MTYKIHVGNNLDILPTLPDNSVDSIVTDPPYELGFMGKKWDSTGIAYSVELWSECLRVLKPGGHLLAFSGSRTYHRMTVAIEDAGFEIRDMISWISNKTFPKSLNISKAIDKAAGAEREVIGVNQNVVRDSKVAGGSDFGGFSKANAEVTASATEEAKKWEGWGTALKPTVEPIVMARKPVKGTVANNVLTYGTGGLNIDASRIGTDTITINTFDNGAKPFGDAVGEPFTSRQQEGRWPANVILDEDAAEILDDQSGQTNSKASNRGEINIGKMAGYGDAEKKTMAGTERLRGHNDSGGASRFFYVAKASKRDRNEGLDELPNGYWELQGHQGNKAEDGISNKSGTGTVAGFSKNYHPTVKPTSLMNYLIKLVTPPGGTVLDPFTGSGSTGKAAILDGFDFVGIEMTEEYLPIIEGRLAYAEKVFAEKLDTENEKLF
jgi:site-specific DNA-methyltransferase (adenine-specific)